MSVSDIPDWVVIAALAFCVGAAFAVGMFLSGGLR